jgi:hypothetical protein
MVMLGAAFPAADRAAAQEKNPFLLAETDDLEVRARVEAGLNLVAEKNLFWEFAETVAGNSDFDSDGEWAEFYVKPGIAFDHRPDDRTSFYGAASVVVSTTVGTDAFAAGNTGQATVEELYLGLRRGDENGSRLDVSFGAREWKAGTGMLLSNGGSNGFSRGALKLGPRRAWRVAALATAASGGVQGTAFYLDPNEAPDNDTGTHIAGVDLRYDAEGGSFVGVTLGKVLDSSSPYPQAPPAGSAFRTSSRAGATGCVSFRPMAGLHPLAVRSKEHGSGSTSRSSATSGSTSRHGPRARRSATPSPAIAGGRRFPMSIRPSPATIPTPPGSNVSIRSIMRATPAPGRRARNRR